jgi:hypothetical protein
MLDNLQGKIGDCGWHKIGNACLTIGKGILEIMGGIKWAGLFERKRKIWAKI